MCVLTHTKHPTPVLPTSRFVFMCVTVLCKVEMLHALYPLSHLCFMGKNTSAFSVFMALKERGK